MMEHQGINKSNYFMYDGWGSVIGWGVGGCVPMEPLDIQD